MATIEKLFNFDDQLLGRQIAGQKEDFQVGQLAPGPWGLMASGINKIGRGLFNNNNDILKEKVAAETALATVQQNLGDDISDPDKLYPALIKELAANGANPKSILQVQEVYSAQKAASNKAELDFLKSKFDMSAKEADLRLKQNKNTDDVVSKNQKALRDEIKHDENYGITDLKSMGIDSPEDSNILPGYRNILDETLSFTDANGNPIFKSISAAKAHIAKVFRKYKNSPELGYDEKFFFWSDDELNIDMFRHYVRAEAGQQVSIEDVLGPPVDEDGNPLMKDGVRLEWSGNFDADGKPTLKKVGE